MLEQNKIYLHNCDNMEYMANIPDNFFELAIVDPPYGLARFKKGGSHINKHGSEKKEWNNNKPTKEYFEQLFRISEKQIIWGGNNFDLPASEYFIIWQKSNAEDFRFAMCEMAWTNCKVPAKIYTSLHVQNSEIRIHPTQKPVALYKWLLSKYAKKGDKIFDSHLGSMSSVIAAYEMGFEIHGCELDTEYFEAGKNRVITHLRQLKLF